MFLIVLALEKDKFQGYLHDMALIIYGTEHEPGVPVDEQVAKYECHEECKGGCQGPRIHQCKKCKNHYYYVHSKKVRSSSVFSAGSCFYPNSMKSLIYLGSIFRGG